MDSVSPGGLVTPGAICELNINNVNIPTGMELSTIVEKNGQLNLVNKATMPASLEAPPEQSQRRAVEMETDSASADTSDSETTSGKTSVEAKGIQEYNKGVIKCWHCRQEITAGNISWNKTQTSTKEIVCNLCRKPFLLKSKMEMEIITENGKISEASRMITITYTTGKEHGVQNIIACEVCQRRKSITTIPIDNLVSEEWHLCICGKDQCVQLKYVPKDGDKSQPSTKKRRRIRRRRANAPEHSITSIEKVIMQQAPVTAQAQASGKFHESGVRDFPRICDPTLAPPRPEGEPNNSVTHAQKRTPERESNIIPSQPTSAQNATHFDTFRNVGKTARSMIQAPSTSNNDNEANGWTTLSGKRPRTLPANNDNIINGSSDPYNISTKNRFSGLSQEQAAHSKRQRIEERNYVSRSNLPDHIPNITVRDDKILNNKDSLKEIRKIVEDNNSTLTSQKGQIKIKPSDSKAREQILAALNNGEIERIISPKPKADRTPSAKIVIKNECYGEDMETIAAEIQNCIGISPVSVKPLGEKAKLHLAIFDGKHKGREIIELFQNTTRRFFAAPRIIVEAFKEKSNYVIQCKKCFAFDHSKQSCYGKQEEPQKLVVTDLGRQVSVCFNCKQTGHSANNVKCPVFQKIIQKHMEQVQEREAKKKERIQLAAVRKGVRYADVTSTRQFPSLPNRNPVPESELQQQTLQQQQQQQYPSNEQEHALERSTLATELRFTRMENRIEQLFEAISSLTTVINGSKR